MSRLYIGRLSHRARDRDVERLFESFGKLREIVLKNGYGFVVSIHIAITLVKSNSLFDKKVRQIYEFCIRVIFFINYWLL